MTPSKFEVDRFLRNTWQKKPLLIRNPWPSWSNPLEPDELAGLACEDDIEARLVTQRHGTFGVEHGPFDDDRFAQADHNPWTLLVQAVDHHVPAVSALLDSFRFIPNWRIDDVMVSYAVDNGGVGAHFDQYDVFLVQGLGRRRWQVGGRCDAATALLPHDDLRLLADFSPTQEWILEPGDILYVPPGIAHNGIAVGDDCMTYSIGLRAPSARELLEGWTESLLDQLEDDDRYIDPDLARQGNPGEITADAVARLHTMVTGKLGDREAFARWFGGYTTTPKNPEIDWRPEQPTSPEEAAALLAEGTALLRNPASRFSFIRQPGAGVLLFVDGESFACAAETSAVAARLAAADLLTVEPDELTPPTLQLIVDLLDRGSLAFDIED